MADATEVIRRQRLVEINAESSERGALAAKYGQVWNTAELCAEFEVLGFMAPYVVVQRKADGDGGRAPLGRLDSDRLARRILTADVDPNTWKIINSHFSSLYRR